MSDNETRYYDPTDDNRATPEAFTLPDPEVGHELARIQAERDVALDRIRCAVRVLEKNPGTQTGGFRETQIDIALLHLRGEPLPKVGVGPRPEGASESHRPGKRWREQSKKHEWSFANESARSSNCLGVPSHCRGIHPWTWHCWIPTKVPV